MTNSPIDTPKTDPDLVKPASTNSTLFILVTVMLSSVGFGLIIPIMPALLEELTGLGTAEATRWGGYVALTYAGMNFLFSPFLGSLSDRFGRRPVLLGSLIMMTVDYIIMGLASSLSMLFVARMLTGISGATFATANAYVADTTEPEKRATAFGMVGAAFGMGFIIGPVLGGIIGEFLGPRAPFFAAAGVSCLNMLYGYFVLPESLKPENRRAFEWSRANPVGAFKSVARVHSVRWILLAVFLFSIAHFVYPAIWSFYAKARFNWSELNVGISLAVFGATGAVSQVFLIKFIIARMGAARTAVFGLAMEAITFFGLAITGHGYLAYIWMIFSAFGAVSMPAINQIMSSRTSAEEQGELQGAISCLNAMASILSTLVMTQLFATYGAPEASIYLPGAPFFLSCLLVFGAAVILNFALKRTQHLDEKPYVKDA